MDRRVTIDGVLLSLLHFEHRYIPYEGMRRDELFAAVMADVDHDVDGQALLGQARRRVQDMADDALTGERENLDSPESEEVDEDEMRRITIVAAASAAWIEGFAIGVYHARRVGALPPTERTDT